MLYLIKNKIGRHLKNKDILDIVIFGSAVKGKSLPKDIDIAIISETGAHIEVLGTHVSILKPVDFFKNPPSLVHTLLREGYSLRNNKYLSETYKFLNKTLFVYNLAGLTATTKVKVVNALRGKNSDKGLVKESNGEWLAKQVFIVPVGVDYIIEQFFLNFKVKYKKHFILIH